MSTTVSRRGLASWAERADAWHAKQQSARPVPMNADTPSQGNVRREIFLLTVKGERSRPGLTAAVSPSPPLPHAYTPPLACDPSGGILCLEF